MRILRSDRNGQLAVNGVEIRKTDPKDLILQPGRYQYVDVVGLGPLVHRLFQDTEKRWSPVNTIIQGPAGCGKSLFWHHFAQEYQIPFLTHVCSEGSRDIHWKGCFTIKDKTTPFILGVLASAIQAANDGEKKVAMLLLEELNALPPPTQKMLNSVTDFRTMVDISELGWRLELAPDSCLIIVGTCVTGAGTYPLNEDLLSRFEVLTLDYPSTPEAELEIVHKSIRGSVEGVDFWKTAQTFMRVIQQSRANTFHYGISTRESVRLVEIAHRAGWDMATYFMLQKFQLQSDRDLISSQLKDMGWNMIPKTLREAIECTTTEALSPKTK